MLPIARKLCLSPQRTQMKTKPGQTIDCSAYRTESRWPWLLGTTCMHMSIYIYIYQFLCYRSIGIRRPLIPLCILYYSVIGLLQMQRLETFLFSLSWCGWLSWGLSRTELSSENFQGRSPVFSYLKMVTEEPWHFAGTSGSSVQWPLGSGSEHGLCF